MSNMEGAAPATGGSTANPGDSLSKDPPRIEQKKSVSIARLSGENAQSVHSPSYVEQSRKIKESQETDHDDRDKIFQATTKFFGRLKQFGSKIPKILEEDLVWFARRVSNRKGSVKSATTDSENDITEFHGEIFAKIAFPRPQVHDRSLVVRRGSPALHQYAFRLLAEFIGVARLGAGPLELGDYLEHAFGLTPEERSALWAQAQNTSTNASHVGHVCVEVGVLRGENLLGKDIDGKSDPYVVVAVHPEGVVPSFKQPGSKKKNNWKASRTVPNNLNPKWNENFEFEVQMPLENSTLYMSVWDSDHQDHGHSATQLSLAGVGRLVRNVSKRAHGKSDDDFLGWAKVPLKEVPAEGLPSICLELLKRSSHSHVRGNLYVSIHFQAANSEAAAKEEDTDTLVVLYKEMLGCFIEYETAQAGGDMAPIKDWNCALSEEAHIMISQASVQAYIRKLQKDICAWTEIVKFFLCNDGRALTGTLATVLKDIVRELEKGQEVALSTTGFFDSLELLLDHLLNAVGNVFSFYGTTDAEVERLEACVSMLRIGYKARLIAHPGVPTVERRRNSLSRDLNALLEAHLVQRFDEIYKKSRVHREFEGRKVVESVKLVQAAKADLVQMFKSYRNAINIIPEMRTYFLMTMVYDKFLTAAVKEILADLSEPEDAEAGTIIFELYFELHATTQLAFYVLEREQIAQLSLINFSEWFVPHIVNHLNLSKVNGMKWITTAVDIDKAVSLTGEVQHSSSILDCCRLCTEIWEFWLKMLPEKWKQVTESHLLSMQTADTITTLMSFYVVEIQRKLKDNGCYDLDGQFDISKELCITLNNIQEALTFVDGMRARVEQCMIANVTNAPSSKEHTDAHHAYVRLVKELFDTTDDEMCRQRDIVANKVRITKKEFNQEINPSDAIKAIDPMLDYLDENLQTSMDYLYKDCADILLRALWRETLQSFRDVLIPPGKCKGHDRMFKFHTHRYAALLMFFQPVYNFFYQDGDGMSTKELRGDPLFGNVQQLLVLSNSDTDFLVMEYYRKMAWMRPVTPTALGVLKVKIQISGSGSHYALGITVLSGDKMVVMDRTSSDPYVVGNVYPADKCNASEFRTKHKKHTLSPEWNHEVKIMLTNPALQDMAVHFSVLDHDLMTSPDPMGECAVWLGDPRLRDGMELTCNLTAEVPSHDDGWQVWDSRTQDFSSSDPDETEETSVLSASDLYCLLKHRTHHDKMAQRIVTWQDSLVKAHHQRPRAEWVAPKTTKPSAPK